MLNDAFFSCYLAASRPLTAPERRYLFAALEQMEKRPEGAFLRGIPWRLYQYRWCDALLERPAGAAAALAGFPDVMGAFDVKGGRIFLQPSENEQYGVSGRAWCWLIAATAVHELRHAYQRLRLGWLPYALLALPGVRELTREPPARRAGAAAEKLVEEIDAAVSAMEFEKFAGRNE